MTRNDQDLIWEAYSPKTDAKTIDESSMGRMAQAADSTIDQLLDDPDFHNLGNTEGVIDFAHRVFQAGSEFGRTMGSNELR